MRRVALMLLLAVAAATGQKPQPSRTELAAMERSFDERLKRFNVDSPFEILGFSRGIYLEGYGAVFTAEVNLLQTPGISPFRPAEFSKEEIARVRAAKLSRLPAVRQMMKEWLVASAQSLDSVPQEEQVAVALFLFSKPWEDRSGLPQQLLLKGKRRALVDVAMNRATPDAVIEERLF